MTSPSQNKLELHYCAFHGLENRLEAELKQITEKTVVDETDAYECTAMLLAAGCSVLVQNKDGWTALSEAISYGSHSLVPFLRSAISSDECCLRKIGNCLRLDTHLMDLFGFESNCGKLSLIFNPESQYPMVLLNHSRAVYYSVGGGEVSVLNDVLVLRGAKQVSVRLLQDESSRKLDKHGNRRHDEPKLKHDGVKQSGPFPVKCYTLKYLSLRTIKRYEHLNGYHSSRRKSLSERIRRMSSTVENFSENTSDSSQVGRSLELPRTSTNQVSWEDYISGSLETNQIYLGRKPEIKRSGKHLRLYMAMTTESPLRVTDLNEIFQVLSPMHSFQRLQELLKEKLPPGFPVYIEIPIYPTVTLRFRFKDVLLLPEDYSCAPSVTTNLFTVPPTYKYDGEFRLQAGRQTHRWN